MGKVDFFEWKVYSFSHPHPHSRFICHVSFGDLLLLHQQANKDKQPCSTILQARMVLTTQMNMSAFWLTLLAMTEFWKRQQVWAARFHRPLLSRRSTQRSTDNRERWETFPFRCKQNSSFLQTATSWISTKTRGVNTQDINQVLLFHFCDGWNYSNRFIFYIGFGLIEFHLYFYTCISMKKSYLRHYSFKKDQE